MERETVIAVLQLVAFLRQNIVELRKIVDEQALQVGDRVVIDHALTTITSEVDAIRRTLAGMLDDPTKIDAS